MVHHGARVEIKLKQVDWICHLFEVKVRNADPNLPTAEHG
jgi:hypothetical protein